MIEIKLTEQGKDKVLQWFNDNCKSVVHNYIVIKGAEEDLTIAYLRNDELAVYIPHSESYSGHVEYLRIADDDYTREVIL